MFETSIEIDFDVDDFNTHRRRFEPPIKRKSLASSRNVVKRKFPGPAGIIPDEDDPPNPGLSERTNQEEIPCSQMSFSTFQTSPWSDVMLDYGPLINQYNIKWIHNSANHKRLPRDKAPFLSALIKNIECSEGKNVIVKIALRDLSGEILGTIVHSLYKEYSNSLVAGSVVVLRDCSVQTSNSNNHYLTITPKNLVRIYWRNDEDVKVIKLQEVSCRDLQTDLPKMLISSEQTRRNKFTLKKSEETAFQHALEGLDMDELFGDF